MVEGTAHLDDVILAILRHYREKSRSFTANRQELHRAFFAVKQAFPQHLGDMVFRHKGLFPESLGLDQAVANLEASGLLRRMNQTPYYYEIDDEVEDSYARYVKPRLEERGPGVAAAEEMAAALANVLSVTP